MFDIPNLAIPLQTGRGIFRAPGNFFQDEV